jgi:hypothetical protein
MEERGPSNSAVRICPRGVSDDEVAFFRKNGWVKLDRLIGETEAGILLDRLMTYTGSDASVTARPHRGGGMSDEFFIFAPLAVHHPCGEVRDDLFYGLSHSREMGELARRMLGSSARYWVDSSIVKTASGRQGSSATEWHYDIASTKRSPFTSPYRLSCWISLSLNTPAHGTMRFISTEHRDEKICRIIAEHTVAESLPLLEALGVVSPSLTMRPGDATLHYAGTLHCAPANTTDELRWAYDMTAIPTNARFSGLHTWTSKNMEGVKEGETFPDLRYPVLGG